MTFDLKPRLETTRILAECLGAAHSHCYFELKIAICNTNWLKTIHAVTDKTATEYLKASGAHCVPEFFWLIGNNPCMRNNAELTAKKLNALLNGNNKKISMLFLAIAQSICDVGSKGGKPTPSNPESYQHSTDFKPAIPDVVEIKSLLRKAILLLKYTVGADSFENIVKSLVQQKLDSPCEIRNFLLIELAKATEVLPKRMPFTLYKNIANSRNIAILANEEQDKRRNREGKLFTVKQKVKYALKLGLQLLLSPKKRHVLNYNEKISRHAFLKTTNDVLLRERFEAYFQKYTARDWIFLEFFGKFNEYTRELCFEKALRRAKQRAARTAEKLGHTFNLFYAELFYQIAVEVKKLAKELRSTPKWYTQKLYIPSSQAL